MSQMVTIYRPSGTNDLRSIQYSGSWSGDSQIPNSKSQGNPGLAVFQNKLYILYNGASKDNLYFAWRDLNSDQWAGNQVIQVSGGGQPASSGCPNIVEFRGQLYTVYKGSSRKRTALGLV